MRRLSLAVVFAVVALVSLRADPRVRQYAFTFITSTWGTPSEIGLPVLNNAGVVLYAYRYPDGYRALWAGTAEGNRWVAADRGAFDETSGYALNDLGTVTFTSRGPRVCPSPPIVVAPCSTAGVYRWQGGLIERVVDAVALGLNGVSTPSIAATGTIAFAAQRASDLIQLVTVREPDGTLRQIGSSILALTDSAVMLNDADDVAFIGQQTTASTIQGVYVADATGTIRAAVDSTQGFSGFSDGAVLNNLGAVAFSANTISGRRAVGVAPRHGKIRPLIIADGVVWTDVRRPALNNNGVLAFEGTPMNGQPGIFVGPDPIRDRVVSAGDLLDGEPIDRVEFWRGLNDNGSIAFLAYFADHAAIYRADPIGR